MLLSRKNLRHCAKSSFRSSEIWVLSAGRRAPGLGGAPGSKCLIDFVRKVNRRMELYSHAQTVAQFLTESEDVLERLRS